MPDIQMCTALYQDEETGKTIECGVKNDCYRHTAPSSYAQAWGPPAGDFQAIDGCDNYIPNKKLDTGQNRA